MGTALFRSGFASKLALTGAVETAPLLSRRPRATAASPDSTRRSGRFWHPRRQFCGSTSAPAAPPCLLYGSTSVSVAPKLLSRLRWPVSASSPPSNRCCGSASSRTSLHRPPQEPPSGPLGSLESPRPPWLFFPPPPWSSSNPAVQLCGLSRLCYGAALSRSASTCRCRGFATSGCHLLLISAAGSSWYCHHKLPPPRAESPAF
ncbi:hypothetical protein ACQJBY_037462 [Aegilops geniculata]